MKEYSYQAHHMGTTVSLSFVCSNQPTADAMAKQAFAVIENYEQRFSRFLPESELSALNQTGAGFVSVEFITVMARSLKLAELTNYNFNPLVQVKTLGYTDTYPKLANKTANTKPPQTSYNTDLSLCHINTETSYITLGENQQLDFGGILKGYLAHNIADSLMATTNSCTGCIINIGGDLATRGLDELHQPFIFYLYNPITGNELPVTIEDRSLSTSGTYARQWQTATGIQHHIVDHQNHLNPTTDLVAVSIVADDGALTEALTKLFLTRGSGVATAIAPPDVYHYQYLTIAESGKTTSTII